MAPKKSVDAKENVDKSAQKTPKLKQPTFKKQQNLKNNRKLSEIYGKVAAGSGQSATQSPLTPSHTPAKIQQNQKNNRKLTEICDKVAAGGGHLTPSRFLTVKDKLTTLRQFLTKTPTPQKVDAKSSSESKNGAKSTASDTKNVAKLTFSDGKNVKPTISKAASFSADDKKTLKQVELEVTNKSNKSSENKNAAKLAPDIKNLANSTPSDSKNVVKLTPLDSKNVNPAISKDAPVATEDNKTLKQMAIEKKSSTGSKSKPQKIQSEKSSAQDNKMEDNELQLQPCLPSPSLLIISNGFSHQDFSNLLMISEFFLGYTSFLMPNDKFSVDADLMFKALTNVRFKGYDFIGKMLVSFLEILIHSEVNFNSHTELSAKIDEIPVNKYTASELVRLTSGGLSRTDESDSGVDATSSLSAGETLNETCLEALEDADIYFLTPRMIIDILVFLLNKVLETTNFDDFLKDKEEEMSEAWREKIEAQTQLKKYRLALEAENKGKATGKDKTEQKNENIDKSKSLTLLHFYGKTADSSEKKENEKLTDDEIMALENVTDSDDMIYKVKSRRAIAREEKAKKAAEEKLEREKKKKEMELKAKLDRVAAATEKLNTLQEFFKKVYRHEPIGIDRNYNRYWFFPKSSPGRLYVEKQYNDPTVENENSGDQGTLSTCSKESSSEIWYFYDKIEQLKELKMSLLTKGIRESRLLDNLSKLGNEIIQNLNMNTLKLSDELDESEPAENSFLNFLRDEFLETERKIRFGGMGGITEFDVWTKKIETADTKENFGDCLIEMREGVRPSLLKGSFSSRKVPSKRDGTNLDNGHILTAEELKSAKQSQVWTTAVRKCKTWSRLTVLYYIFHNSIMWEKSAEQAPCKICRRKRDDEKMLLCDQCNDPYHIYCLRPPLKAIPRSDWFCVKCRPPAKKRRVQIEEDEDEDDFSDKEENRKENLCLACEKGESTAAGDLVHCSNCSSAFHMDCHIPPLRHTPRSGWRCCVCVKGISFRRSLRKRRY